ncbi:hypothetical protein ATY81_16445 [Rhizobium sp. R72]|nr:hypothetical protein ATY81_16445 [Rhizobium sp. R72]OWV92958.1 hypothetical protein ATY80_16445 [Rhizobium sp. R711]
MPAKHKVRSRPQPFIRARGLIRRLLDCNFRLKHGTSTFIAADKSAASRVAKLRLCLRSSFTFKASPLRQESGEQKAEIIGPDAALIFGVAAVPGWKSSWTGSPVHPVGMLQSRGRTSGQATPVLCFLGKDRDLTVLSNAAREAIGDFVTGFSIDESYSQAKRDDQMRQSFALCFDRVGFNAWSNTDEEAVAGH